MPTNNKCYRVTAISYMGYPKGKRFPFPFSKTFKSKEEAKKYIKLIKKANKGTYNLKMLFGKPRVEKC